MTKPPRTRPCAPRELAVQSIVTQDLPVIIAIVTVASPRVRPQ